jgi:hypothetical protein
MRCRGWPPGLASIVNDRDRASDGGSDQDIETTDDSVTVLAGCKS